MKTTSRCNLCGGVGRHADGCKNKQGGTFEYRTETTTTTYFSGKVFRDLLEAAEEMFKRTTHWTDEEDSRWKAAIDAARKEVEK